MYSIRTLLVAGTLSLVPAGASVAQFDDVVIKPIRVADGVYMLEGRGGNIGLSVGDDDAFMIDDQFGELTGKILDAVKTLTDKPVRFVVNTHWHGDHTGGNENMGGGGSIIVAHENVRKRMSKEQFMKAFNRTVPAAPEVALPVVTFEDAVTFHWNGDDLHVFHVDPAHTDGDSIVHFRKANVLHMGDTFFNGMYPFIDVGSGGNIDGMVAAADRALTLTDEKTRIIPGHGPLAGTSELRDYRNMLAGVRDRIRSMVDRGMSRDEVIAGKPTRDLDEEWGGGFMKPDAWVGIVYDGMTQ